MYWLPVSAYLSKWLDKIKLSKGLLWFLSSVLAFLKFLYVECVFKFLKYAFGQHSGVIDLNKDKFELPRFPINEKYGELKRFKSIVNYFPLEYKRILPEEKQLFVNTNPPNFKVEFFKEQKNLSNINCYSNEGDVWEKSKTRFANNSLTIEFREPFKPRRGRINCSLNDNGKWRWFGVQFPIKVK